MEYIIISALIGLIVGFGIGFLLYFLSKNKMSKELEEWKQKFIDIDKKLVQSASELEDWKQKFTETDDKLELSTIELEDWKRKFFETDKKLAQTITEIEKCEQKFFANEQKLIQSTTELEDWKQKFFDVDKKLAQAIGFEEWQKKATMEFENIANHILGENSEKSKNSLADLLNPLREQINQFKEKVDVTSKEADKERHTFGKIIEQMMDMYKTMSKETSNLTNALKGSTKLQGNWGELILERTLESAGLNEGKEYKTQKSFTGKFNDDREQRLQPDIVLYLPDNKHLIIDSKVSLISYEAYINEEKETKKEQYLNDFIKSIEQHIKNLSGKQYQNIDDLNTPDFVLMFIPIENAYNLLIEKSETMFMSAYDKKIVIVSPSNLMAILKTISSLWKTEYQNKNILEIAKLGGEIYDKAVDFSNDIEDVGKHLSKSIDALDNARNKLCGQRGLVSKTQKMKELGIKAKKDFPSTLLDNISE